MAGRRKRNKEYVRTTISIPTGVYLQMVEKLGDQNWSEIASAALAHACGMKGPDTIESLGFRVSKLEQQIESLTHKPKG